MKYSEIFQIIPGESRFTLIPNVTSELLNILKNNQSLKNEIFNQLTSRLNSNVYFSTHGTDIVINLVKLELIQLDIPIYSVILSYADQQEVNKFCNIYRNVCKSTSFWIELIRNKFPEYYIPGVIAYDWKKLYYDLSWYTYRINYIEQMKTGKISSRNKYQEVLDKLNTEYYLDFRRYLILNDLIELDYEKVEHFMENPERELLEHMFNKIQQVYNLLMTALDLSLDGKHTKELEYLMEYRRINSDGSITQLSKNSINELLDDIFSGEIGEIIINSNDMELLFKKLYDEHIMNRLSFMSRQNYLILTDDNIIHMLRNYPKLTEKDLSHDQLMSFFLTEDLHYKLTREVYNRSKNMLTIEDLIVIGRAIRDYQRVEFDMKYPVNITLEESLDVLVAHYFS